MGTGRVATFRVEANGSLTSLGTVGGLVSVPFEPPFMRSLKELNVACGLSSTIAVS